MLPFLQKCSYPISPKILSQREKCRPAEPIAPGCRRGKSLPPTRCLELCIRSTNGALQVHSQGVPLLRPLAVYWQAKITRDCGCFEVSSQRKPSIFRSREPPRISCALNVVSWNFSITDNFLVFHPIWVIYFCCVHLYFFIPCYFHHLFLDKEQTKCYLLLQLPVRDVST